MVRIGSGLRRITRRPKLRPLTIEGRTLLSIRKVAKFQVKRFVKYRIFPEYYGDFEGFCVNILGVQPWGKQLEIAKALEENRQVTVAACYGSGKTNLAACFVLYWLFTRSPSLAVTTAPTSRQVRKALWREIRKLHAGAKVRLGGHLNQLELILADNHQAFGFTAGKQANAASGIHEGCPVLFIIDEAAGVRQDSYEDYAGLTTSEGSRKLLIGNPICTEGPFWDSHNHPKIKERFVRFQISAYDCPNVVAQKNVIDGMVTQEWLDTEAAAWLENGLEHLYKQRALGQFVSISTEKLILSLWVEDAQGRWKTADRSGERVFGVDVAGGGRDCSVICFKEGDALDIIKSWHDDNTVRQARLIADLAIKHRVERIVVDATHIGAGVFDQLKELQVQGVIPARVHLVGLKLYDPPKDNRTFVTQQSEILWHLRQLFDPAKSPKIALNPLNTVAADQVTWRGWEQLRSDGRILVDGKKKLKKERGYKVSPDEADAISMACLKIRRMGIR